MSTRNNNRGDRSRWGMEILGSLAWKPFGVAEDAGPQAAVPKRRVARGALNSHGLIGQPKQRRGSRGQRRRQSDEHISRTGGGGWVAVNWEKSYSSSSSSSSSRGVANAHRAHAANMEEDYCHTPPHTSPTHAPQAGRDLSPSQTSNHHHHHHHQQQHQRQYVTPESAWMYDDRGFQTAQASRVRSPSHISDQRPSQAAHQVHHTPQHQRYLEGQHQQQQQQQQYVRRQPPVQHVSADNRRYHVHQEVQHQQGQCYR